MPKKLDYIILTCFFVFSFVYYSTFIKADDSLSTRTAGKILLQVEENGEAWYVHPISNERYFLGRPSDAFSMMNTLGLGISNADIQKIPIHTSSFKGTDSDQDGLSDAFESAIGTDAFEHDSDHDGYSDYHEILNNYNPMGGGKIEIDKSLAKLQKGKILLQVEQNGEAWYVNPDNNMRYFLGRPRDAFEIMRSTGLGISNTDIAGIVRFDSSAHTTILNTVVVDNGNRKYADSNISFEYPNTWKMSKINGKRDAVFIRNYDIDILEENKAMITVAYVEMSEAIDLDRFKTASKTDAVKKETTLSQLEQFDYLKEVYEVPNIEGIETTNFVKLNDHEMAIVTLFSAGNHQHHESVLGEVLRSVKKPE